MLNNKVIYVVTTGANKSKDIKILLDYLKAEGATCILMPTPNSCKIMNLRAVEEYRIKKDFTFNRADSVNERIPEENAVVVAPCTFNTLSKIANGIADNYPLSIIHSAIGYGKYIVIAPSMNQGYFNHPITQENIAKINSFGNVSIIYPEYIYNENGELDRITMAPWEKILDSICHKYNNIRYENKKVDFDMSSIIDKYFPEFFSVGKFLQENQYTNGTAGFIARKIPEGILITSTGSSVGALSRENLTLILDCKAHIVSWSGNNMPSSETPLVIELFNSFPNKNVIIHGHCKDITYSNKTLKYNSTEYLRYGEWGELYKIKPVIDKYQKGIMKLHGEIILADNFDEALSMYSEMYQETLI